MSPTSRPLLIGSYAAKLRGILPAWRQGHVADIDMVTSEAVARSIAAALGTRYREHAPGRCYLSGRIDIDLRGHLIERVIHACDLVTVDIHGCAMAALLPHSGLIVAMRQASWDAVPGSERKALADLEGFARLRLQSTAALIELAAIFRRPDPPLLPIHEKKEL